MGAPRTSEQVLPSAPASASSRQRPPAQRHKTNAQRAPPRPSPPLSAPAPLRPRPFPQPCTRRLLRLSRRAPRDGDDTHRRGGVGGSRRARGGRGGRCGAGVRSLRGLALARGDDPALNPGRGPGARAGRGWRAAAPSAAVCVGAASLRSTHLRLPRPSSPPPRSSHPVPSSLHAPPPPRVTTPQLLPRPTSVAAFGVGGVFVGVVVGGGGCGGFPCSPRRCLCFGRGGGGRRARSRPRARHRVQRSTASASSDAD